MLERTFDAEFFNRIANLPEVRPGLAPKEYGELDLSPVIANPNNYALRTEHGGFILIGHGAGFYSVHTQFAAEGRGAHAGKAMRAGLDFMFTRTDCMHIHSHCPDSNRPALQLALKGGAKPWFRNEVEPRLGPGMAVRWDLLDWIVSNADLEREGMEFHALAEPWAKEHGLPEHADDPIHDRAVGATVRMARNGQIRKGVLSYNLWALSAMYPPARFISDDPPTIDAGLGMIVSLAPDGQMEVR